MTIYKAGRRVARVTELSATESRSKHPALCVAKSRRICRESNRLLGGLLEFPALLAAVVQLSAGIGRMIGNGRLEAAPAALSATRVDDRIA